jgi:hypothetical protein
MKNKETSDVKDDHSKEFEKFEKTFRTLLSVPMLEYKHQIELSKQKKKKEKTYKPLTVKDL